MTAVLVTGGRGFVGARLCDRLREDDVQVVAPSRTELDLTDVEAVEAFLRHHEIETVVHLASSLDRRPLPEAEAAQWRDTFTTGRVVLEASARAGVRRAIAAGSMDEIGVVEGFVGPDVPIAPMTTYGLCKALVLETARFLTARSDLRVEWFRPTAIYGPGQAGSMLVPSAFRSGASGEPTPFTSGVQQRDFIYIDDVVDWTVRAIALRPTDASGVTVHHVGTGEPVAVADVLKRIESLTGGTFELGALPRRAGEPDLFAAQLRVDHRSPLDGWTPTVGLDEGLERTWQAWSA